MEKFLEFFHRHYIKVPFDKHNIVLSGLITAVLIYNLIELVKWLLTLG